MLKVGNMAAAPGPLECTGRRTIFGDPFPPINFVHDHLLVSNIIIIFLYCPLPIICLSAKLLLFFLLF